MTSPYTKSQISAAVKKNSHLTNKELMIGLGVATYRPKMYKRAPKKSKHAGSGSFPSLMFYEVGTKFFEKMRPKLARLLCDSKTAKPKENLDVASQIALAIAGSGSWDLSVISLMTNSILQTKLVTFCKMSVKKPAQKPKKVTPSRKRNKA
jgi:hypothetical protein